MKNKILLVTIEIRTKVETKRIQSTKKYKSKINTKMLLSKEMRLELSKESKKITNMKNTKQNWKRNTSSKKLDLN